MDGSLHLVNITTGKVSSSLNGLTDSVECWTLSKVPIIFDRKLIVELLKGSDCKGNFDSLSFTAAGYFLLLHLFYSCSNLSITATVFFLFFIFFYTLSSLF